MMGRGWPERCISFDSEIVERGERKRVETPNGTREVSFQYPSHVCSSVALREESVVDTQASSRITGSQLADRGRSFGVCDDIYIENLLIELDEGVVDEISTIW